MDLDNPVPRLGQLLPLEPDDGGGPEAHIRDSAVLFGEVVVGVFFDVTALMSSNAELKDALQVQELLNDSILAGAKVLQKTQGAAIRTLARLAEYRDPETGLHLQRICEYTRLLALQVTSAPPIRSASPGNTATTSPSRACSTTSAR